MTRSSIRVLVTALIVAGGGVTVAVRPHASATSPLDVLAFSANALVRAPDIVDCALESG